MTVKCLLVDDVPENLIALEAVLRQDDVEIHTARSGAQALELLLAHDFALALLDVQMPDMNGFELAELIRGSSRTRHVPLIFMTAGSHDQLRRFHGYDSGAVDFLYKPLEPLVLKSKANVFFELHRQRQALARELHERTEALRLNEMFIAVLGHDLRTPLTAMLASAQLLQRDPDAAAVAQTAARLLSSGQRMSLMIEDLLDFARARVGGGIPLNLAPADLGEIARRAVQECIASCPGRRVDVAAQGDLSGCWDGPRLAQVFANLVGNALRHGSSDVALELDGRDAQTLRIAIANEGTIGPELLPRIFDPFRRRARIGGRSEGLGLGLHIVRQIVLAHAGRIEVESRERTTFRIELPRLPAPAATR